MEIPRFRPSSPEDVPGEPDPLTLLAAWWRAVGEKMAAAASPRGFSRGRLLVAVPDLHWKREVGLHLEEILARLRREDLLQGIQGIDLVLEPRPPRQASASDRAERPVESAEPPLEIALSAESIPDEDLARRWKAAVGLLLARQEKDRER
jgi:hypothetical protein